MAHPTAYVRVALGYERSAAARSAAVTWAFEHRYDGQICACGAFSAPVSHRPTEPKNDGSDGFWATGGQSMDIGTAKKETALKTASANNP